MTTAGTHGRLRLRIHPAQDWPYLLIGAAVLLLTCYRAVTTGITYDEAETYLRYVAKSAHPDPKALFGFLSVQRANNHPLNTILIDVTSALFPYQEWAIRLPNLLAFVLYLGLAASVSRGFRMRPIAFGLLALNPSLDEFFGLGRGYALSAALVLAAFAVRPEKDGDENRLRLSLWLLLLASLANYVAVALLAAFGLEALLALGPRYVARSLRSWGSLAGGLVLGFILWAFAAVTEAGKPLFGDSRGGIWDPLVGSAVRMFAPEWAPPRALLVCLGVALLALLIPPWVGRFRDFHPGRCLVLLLALVTSASHLFGKPMPTDRVLLPFWPLVALSVGEALDFHAKWLVDRRPALAGPIRAGGFVCLAGLLGNFTRLADPTSTRECHDDYARADAVRGPLAKGDCIERRYLPHPVVTFYVKKAGKSLSDPSLVCP